MAKPKTLRDRIRHFTPSWFAVSMGVGVHITLFHMFPFPAGNEKILDIIATCFLVLNIILFFVMTAMTIARYVMYPQVWGLMIHHPVQSMFVGGFPMALATIVNGLVLEAFTRWQIAGPAFLYFVWGLWWFDVALSVLSCFGMLYIMIARHQHEVQSASAVWLLPIVPLVVAGTSGAIVAGALKHLNPSYALVTTFVAVTLIVMCLAIALVVLAVYSLRLIVHGFPAGGLIVSIFVPLGPLGQGGFGLLLVGDLLADLLPQNASAASFLATAGVAQVLQTLTFVTAYCLWAFGFVFIVPAIIGLVSSKRIPIGLPWWGLIFPTGVYTALTIELGNKLDSTFFKVLGTIYSIVIFGLFTTTAIRTVVLVRYGSIFHAPCLDDYPMPTPPDTPSQVEGGSNQQIELTPATSNGDLTKVEPSVKRR